jgi:hypothetical protein
MVSRRPLQIFTLQVFIAKISPEAVADPCPVVNAGAAALAAYGIALRSVALP